MMSSYARSDCPSAFSMCQVSILFAYLESELGLILLKMLAE